MGGMEDYYIAQFFCWREIILLNLEIDIETFSSVNLAKAGVYRYAESPDFEVLLFGYSVDGGEVKVGDLVKGEKIPEEVMSALEDEAVTKRAFNAQFERICISRMLGYEAGTYLVPASWKCSMVWSAYMGLPLSLDYDLTTVYGSALHYFAKSVVGEKKNRMPGKVDKPTQNLAI